MKNVTLIIMILFMMVFRGFANANIVDDFSFWCSDNTQPINMGIGTNLLFRNPVTGLDEEISSDGYWNLGFLYEGNIVGWAKNTRRYLSIGNMSGYYSSELPGDKLPDEVYLIHDVLGDGIGLYDTQSGTWYLGDDDVFYAYDFDAGIFDASLNMLFGPGEVRSDLSTLPTGSESTLPQMILAPVVSGLEDLLLLASFWLEDCSLLIPDSEECELCNKADWDESGRVDLADFSFLASRWLKAY